MNEFMKNPVTPFIMIVVIVVVVSIVKMIIKNKKK